MKNNKELITSMIAGGALKSPQIIEAFEKIDRKNFIPEDFREHIYIDRPLPIGKEQTISQPSTVAFMLERLEPQKGDKILDIGSGSGWTTALLCQIVGEEGSVLGLERHDELVEKGQQSLARLELGDHCRIEKAGKDDQIGDIYVNYDNNFKTYKAWRDELTRPLNENDKERRPFWIKRPVVPLSRKAYEIDIKKL